MWTCANDYYLLNIGRPNPAGFCQTRISGFSGRQTRGPGLTGPGHRGYYSLPSGEHYSRLCSSPHQSSSMKRMWLNVISVVCYVCCVSLLHCAVLATWAVDWVLQLSVAYKSRFIDIRRKNSYTFIVVLQLTYSSSKSTVNYKFATCKL